MHLARRLGHPYSLTFALLNEAQIHIFRGAAEPALASATAGKAVAEQHGFAFPVCWALHIQAWALALLGERRRALACIADIAKLTLPQSQVIRSYLQLYLAEAYHYLAMPEAGLATLADIDDDYVSVDTPEQNRLRGEFLWQQGDIQNAERYLLQAVEDGIATQNRSYTLRALLSLTRLTQNERHRQQLAQFYGEFTEGHDSADLLAVRDLLDSIGT
ncbi:MAG: hypothetical protein R3F37_23165 [Candidatus Competibacteraceae bacterium]